jgi:hypothetical protein
VKIDYRQSILRAFEKLTALRAEETTTFAAIFECIQQEHELPPVKGKSREYLATAKALAHLKNQGFVVSPLRGHWKLSTQGLHVCRTGTVPVKDALQGVPEKSAISQDAEYLWGLTVQNTKCFGWYKKGHASCAECRIRSECQTEKISYTQKVADSLD